MLSPDVEEKILAALQQVFTFELIEKPLSEGDPLALKTLKQAPLQDDPTLTAPYMVYQSDAHEGIVPIKPGSAHDTEYGAIEIGGPFRYLQYYEAVCGTPLATTRELARAAIANLTNRIAQVLMDFYDLSGVLAPGMISSEDMLTRLDGANPYLIDKLTTRIYGGETTFYGEGKIFWHYPFSVYRQYRVFTSL